MDWISDFSATKPRTVIFASGDDQEAKRVVLDLLNQIGFAGIDLGSLAKGGAMQRSERRFPVWNCTLPEVAVQASGLESCHSVSSEPRAGPGWLSVRGRRACIQADARLGSRCVPVGNEFAKDAGLLIGRQTPFAELPDQGALSFDVKLNVV
jgi:hypothetical protein